MSDPVVDIASAIQSASIKRHPSPAHDLNPSTAASKKQPVSPTTSMSSDASTIPESVLKPVPRRANLPPLPDMRFEQSYLASLQGAESWWRIAWITGRDQVWHNLLVIAELKGWDAEMMLFTPHSWVVMIEWFDWNTACSIKHFSDGVRSLLSVEAYHLI
ncbi:MAG: hypothetical protein Q9228_001202 [Teloschistes exilis]